METEDTHRIFISPSRIPLWRRGFCKLLLTFRVNYLAAATAQQDTPGAPDTALYQWNCTLIGRVVDSCAGMRRIRNRKVNFAKHTSSHWDTANEISSSNHRIIKTARVATRRNDNTDSSAAISRRSGYKCIQNVQVQSLRNTENVSRELYIHITVHHNIFLFN
jgi:hypothetical protein